jgi:hypothetical protein
MGEVFSLEHVGRVAAGGQVELGVGAQSAHVAAVADAVDLAEQRVAPARLYQAAGLALVSSRRRTADTEDGKDGQQPKRQPPCEEKHHDAC